ncbi:MAG TPA: PEP-CTERM sorting domain-containing protein [Pyrinomonadaceae bacterium]|nr:PEP-CTERM sorting domain-containing protein [Pyrinomonadaceae bacterium]
MFPQPNTRLRRRMFVDISFVLLMLLLGATSTHATEITIWNFNDSDLLADFGTGTLMSDFNVANILFAAGTTTNARLGAPAGQALSLQGGTGTANNGRNITFSVSTLGFANIIVSFATQGTSTGFNANQFQYSLDGLTFVNFGSPYTPATAFGSTPVIFNLSAIPGLNDNPSAAFRIVFNGSTSSTGNNRLDNLVIEGTAATATIPEPTTALLLLTGLTGILGLKRKRQVAAQRARPPGLDRN